jgi:hypothetical protein
MEDRAVNPSIFGQAIVGPDTYMLQETSTLQHRYCLQELWVTLAVCPAYSLSLSHSSCLLTYRISRSTAKRTSSFTKSSLQGSIIQSKATSERFKWGDASPTAHVCRFMSSTYSLNVDGLSTPPHWHYPSVPREQKDVLQSHQRPTSPIGSTSIITERICGHPHEQTP